MRKVKYYKCPECGKKFKTLGGWGDHIQTMHPTTIPEGFTISRYFYFTLTGKTAGRCIMCHGDTLWNEATGKYDRYCTNPKCKQEYVKIAKKRMRDKYGKEHILNDPEMQRKMLASKKISGEYAFSDGSGKLGYVGTYEKDFLMMMDKFMHYSATDIMAPSPHTYYYEYENEKHFYIPDFYVPNLNLEIEIKAQDNTHPKIQAIDKVKERLKDEMMAKNPKINYLKINDKNYNNFFEYLLNLKEQVDDKDLTKEVKSSAEFKAATESFFNYYENDEAMEFVSLTKEEPKASGTNPVVIVFSSKVNPILQAVGFNTRDRFSEFGICLSNPSDPIGYDYYALTPVSENLYPGGPIAMFFKKTLSIYIERVIGWDNPCMSFVTFVDDSTYEALKNRLNNHKPFTFNFNSDIITWFSHSDRYRFFCHKMINLVTEKEFESRDYILLTIANNAREFIEDMKNKLSILANSPMGPARERQAFEEHVMEEFYGTLPEEYEQALESAFTGWEDIEIEEPTLEEGYEYIIDIEPIQEATILNPKYYINTKNHEFNIDKWQRSAGKNILWITGFSGSGKSTLSKKIESETDNCVAVNLDTFVMRNPSNYAPMYKDKSQATRMEEEFFNYYADKGLPSFDETNERVRVTIALEWLEDYAKKHSNTLFIFEGVWVTDVSIGYLKTQPLIVMGTSVHTATTRNDYRKGGFNSKAHTKYYYEKQNKKREEILKAMNVVEPAIESIKLKTNFNRVKIKGTLSLQKFTRTELTQEVLDKYKEKCPSFGHCRISNMSKGYLYTDKSDEIVGFVNVVRKQDNIKWIQALNIQPKYQGYGLYEQIMKVAVRELGGTDIETPPKNDTAKLVYKKFGFKTYTNEPTSHAMSIRADAKREKYSGRAKPNAKTMTESGLSPVYILLSDIKTTFGNVVKFFTQAPYCHASISFESSMTKLYSFSSRDGHTMIPLGFSEENIANFAKKAPKAKYALYVKLVDSKDLSKMKTTLRQFTKNKSSFRYDLSGAIKAYMGKHNANEKKYFCSGFVAYILNSGKSQVTENDSDLTKPMDIADIKNIHLVDMGLCKDYNQAYVEKKTKQIFEKHYMHKEKDSHHQPIDEEAELEESKAKEKESEDKE